MHLSSNVLTRTALALISGGLLIWVALALWQFPWVTDGPTNRAQEQAAFYATAYNTPKALTESERLREEKYVSVARRAAEAANVEGMVRS